LAKVFVVAETTVAKEVIDLLRGEVLEGVGSVGGVARTSGGGVSGSVEKRRSASVLMRVRGPVGCRSAGGAAGVSSSKAPLSMVRAAGLILAV